MKKLAWCAVLLATMSAAANGQANQGGAGAKLPWLHEGLRLTYRDVEWIYHGTDLTLYEDANGDFCTPDGTRLSASGRGGGTSFSGVNEEMVSRIDGGFLLLAGDFYNNEQVSGLPAPVLLPQTLATKAMSASDADEYWQRPEKLAGMQSDPNQGLTVSRLSWRVGNTAHDAVRLEYNNPSQRVYKAIVYDLHSGMGLHQATVTTGVAPQYYFAQAGQEGDTTTIQCDLVEVHDVVVPWASEPWSDAFKSIRVLHYSGESDVVKVNARTALQMDFAVEKWGDGWVKMGVTTTTQMPGYPAGQTKGEMLFGSCSLIRFWIPPAYLVKMRQGDVLDRDDTTLSTTSVAQENDNSVTIASVNSSGGITSQYDKGTGLLMAQQTNVAGIQPIETTLRLIGKE